MNRHHPAVSGHRPCRLIRAFLRRRGGGILLETAVAIPLLVLLLLGGVDVARYFLAGQKLQRAAMTVADLTARSETLSQTDIDNIFAAASEITAPLDLNGQGRVYVASVVESPEGDPEVAWQRDTGTLSIASRLDGMDAETSSDLAPLVSQNRSAIVAEITGRYEPLFGYGIAPKTLYQRAIFRPRLSREVFLE